MEIEDILQGEDTVKFTKSLQLRWYGHVEECKTKKCQNTLQQLQWKEQEKEEHHVEDRDMRVKRS
jgi:hypothetical protein